MFTSCKKENIDTEIDITLHEWQVKKIRKEGELNYLNSTENYVFKFKNNMTFTFNLDVNSCGGHYRILNKSNLEISNKYCTEICCDSEYAEELLHLLPRMRQYYIQDNKLVFEGQGEIIFEKSK